MKRKIFGNIKFTVNENGFNYEGPGIITWNSTFKIIIVLSSLKIVNFILELIKEFIFQA